MSALIAALLLAVASCGNDDDTSSAGTTTPPGGPPSSAALQSGSIPAGDAPIEPGTYRIPKSAWSVADFTVTFPEDWTVQYGHVYAGSHDLDVEVPADGEFGFYAVVVDAIAADACAGIDAGVVEVGPNVDDLVTALRQQPGARVSDPIDTTLGGVPAVRVDLTIPKSLELADCSFGEVGLQIWYSAPADKYFVLLADALASVYILDIDGDRQVFLTQRGPATSPEDLAELQTVLDSIRIEP